VAPEPRASADTSAIALLFFFAATGHSFEGAPSPSARAKELGVDLPLAIDGPLRRALSHRPEDAFASPRALATSLVEALAPGAAPAPYEAPAAMPVPPPMTFEAPPPPPRRTGLVLGLTLGGLAVMAALGLVLTLASRRSAPAPIATPAVSTGAPIASVAAVTAPPEPIVAPAVSSEPVVAPAAPAEPEDLPLAAGEGELRIVCEPVACTNIAIDGKVGTNQGPFALKAGKHGIGVSTPGYGGLWEMVTVTAGERTVQRFALSPTRAAPTKSCGKFLDRCN
jgi:hypothetical protein